MSKTSDPFSIQPCGCHIVIVWPDASQPSVSEFQIRRCPLHERASDLRSTCEALLLVATGMIGNPETVVQEAETLIQATRQLLREAR